MQGSKEAMNPSTAATSNEKVDGMATGKVACDLLAINDKESCASWSDLLSGRNKTT